MTNSNEIKNNLLECANKVAVSLDADVLLINAYIERRLDDRLINMVSKRRRRKNVLLILVTLGGDADAAYRIARCLQDSYERFIAIITGYCKSGGTLCVLGAHEIVMSEAGELGPLDVQFYKKDEIGELSSGLVATEALEVLQQKAFSMFEEYFLAIKTKSFNQITFKTATEIAIKISVGLLEPLYRQFDPIQVGEMARSMKIATAYGIRLMVRSRNFTEETLKILSMTYPSHSFVIDKSEVEELFDNVRVPSLEEDNLRSALGDLGYVTDKIMEPKFLSDEIEGEENEKTTGTSKQNGIKETKQEPNTSGDEKDP